MAVTLLLQDQIPWLSIPGDPGRVFYLSDVLTIFCYNEKVCFSQGQLCWTHRFSTLQPFSRPCSIELMYPREWRSAIPASLMRCELTTGRRKARTLRAMEEPCPDNVKAVRVAQLLLEKLNLFAQRMRGPGDEDIRGNCSQQRFTVC